MSAWIGLGVVASLTLGTCGCASFEEWEPPEPVTVYSDRSAELEDRGMTPPHERRSGCFPEGATTLVVGPAEGCAEILLESRIEGPDPVIGPGEVERLGVPVRVERRGVGRMHVTARVVDDGACSALTFGTIQLGASESCSNSSTVETCGDTPVVLGFDEIEAGGVAEYQLFADESLTFLVRACRLL